MEKKMTKKLLAILMIITILSADFFVLGSNLITYATQVSSETSNSNVEFSAYLNSETKDNNLTGSIKDNNLKLYAEIKINSNDGYLKDGASIQIENSNFNLKSEILSTNTHIASIEGNKVNLKQIDNSNGKPVKIVLGIEPIISENITTDFLAKVSTVRMSGTYVYSQAENGEPVSAEKEVCVNYQPDETTGAELDAEIITNKELAVNGENKRVVQVLVKSRLTNNEYPVEQTTLNVEMPDTGEIVPEISVMAIDELATNGLAELSNGSYTRNGQNIQIVIKNEANTANEIKWKKNAYDELVITYLYPADITAAEVSTGSVASQIKVYGITEPYKNNVSVRVNELIEEPSQVIIGKTEITTEEMYKGKIYANIDEQYNTKTSIIVTNANIVDEIVVNEKTDTYVTTESELPVNSKYVTTEVNLEKMLAILGQDGNIEIKNGDVATLINKDSTVNENGNVVITHNLDTSTSELVITTNKPVATGILEINHTKVITGNTYTREQLQKVATLKTKGSLLGTITVNKEKKNIVQTSTETINSSIELKETISKAELTVDKTTLSTIEENEVTVRIKLITDGAQYDLYKNPAIALQMPSAVENVEFLEEPSKVYADDFETISQNYDATKKVVSVAMTGEQTSYPKSSLQQAYIQLKLKVTLNQLAIAQTDKITLGYKNEKAVQYEGGTTYGVIEQPVEISAPSELITKFNLSSNENTSSTETILQRVKETEAGKTLDFTINLLNNKDSNISNVKILGKLPTTGLTITGKEENTLETTLTNIVAENATIYYTENVEATVDTQNTTNGWTQDLTTLTNAKLYLIKLDGLARGTDYSATVTVQMPNPLTENTISYTEYEVIYDTATAAGLSDNSRKIGLATSMAASIGVTTTAQVGQEILENGDAVKEGEVIKYTVTVKNNGTQTLQNVQLNLDVPEGTVYVRPIPREVAEDGTIVEGTGYVYAGVSYYEEITDSTQLEELTTITIPELTTTTPYTIDYEVRVNKGAANTEISSKNLIIYDESTIECEEMKNIVKESNIRVTVKRTIDESVQLIQNELAEYVVIIENTSTSTIRNLEMQIITEGFNISTINDEYKTSNNIEISEILPKDESDLENPKNGIETFKLYGNIDRNALEMSIYAIVNDSEGEKYRSNVAAEVIQTVDGRIRISSPQNGEYIKEGDTVEYNIVIKNTSSIEGFLEISDIIPEYLEIQEIYENGVIKKQKTDEVSIGNEIYYPVNLKPQEQAQIDIITKVGYIPELYHGSIIANTATVEVLGVVDIFSTRITHILKASTLKDENIENVISGFAWFDENANGQKDVEEKTLSGINVKLYDTRNNYYVKDEYGDFVQTETNANGEYSFSKIQDGSYLVIFEYDTEIYEFTTPLAQGVDTSLNSKASLKYINTEAQQIRVAAIEVNNLNENVFNMNIGLKGNTGETPKEEQPGVTDNPVNPEKPGNPENPEKPENPGEPGESQETKTISGLAWLDSNRNGQKDENEEMLLGVKVKIYDVTSKKYLTDSNGNTIQTTTDNAGKYEISNVQKGSYIIIFEYDTKEYEPTTYMAEGVATTKNSKAILNKININGQEITLAVTDTINVQDNVYNMNIGLKEKLIFDLELNKYISRIVLQNSKGTKAYDYAQKSLAKVEIHKKQMQGSLVVIEYTIKVKNNGEISGYAKNIVDYLPNGLTFSSELNSDWYLAENNLYTKCLENTELKPGEEKEIKLILTKTMTNENTGLINNRAEINKDYNKYGENDIDSTPNNQVSGEDDMSSADVIIGISTGGSITTYVILLTLNLILIAMAISLMIKNNIIKVSINKERR